MAHYEFSHFDSPEWRIDIWHSDTELPSRDRIHVENGRDRSPSWTTYPTGYDSRCHCCYHGHGHSTQRHEAAIRAALFAALLQAQNDTTTTEDFETLVKASAEIVREQLAGAAR